MTFTADIFAKAREYSYHLTSSRNLELIATTGRVDCAASLIRKDGRVEWLRRRRLESWMLRVDGRSISLRDQSPLLCGHLILFEGCMFEDLVEALNSRVFFWPG